MPRAERRSVLARRAGMGPEARFSIPVRTYYQDTDAGGVVYHGAYLHYFERARTEWLRHLGFDIRAIAEEQGVLFIVREIRVAYAKPAVLDDRLTVTAGVERLGLAQFTCAQEVLRGGEVLVEAAVNLACVEAQGFKPARVPDGMREALDAYLQRVQQKMDA